MANISLTIVQIEQLIELVRENPGLYDPSHHYHKDQIWTRNVWEKIARKGPAQTKVDDLLQEMHKQSKERHEQIAKLQTAMISAQSSEVSGR